MIRLTARPHARLPLGGTPGLLSLAAVTAAGNGTTYNLQRAFSNWEVQITTTGGPSFSVQLQGALDGQTLVNVGSPITAAGLTNVTSNTPLTMVRLVLVSLTGGTNPTLTGVLAGTEAPAGAGGGGGGGGPVTVADGADVAEGATTDVGVVGDNPGSVSAKLRGINTALAAGVATTTADGGSVTLGAKADAAAATDTATASLLSLFKRLLQRVTTLLGQLPTALTGSGNLKTAIAEATATVPISAVSLPLPTGAAADASVAATNTTLGATTDAATTGDSAGSLSAKLRGLTKILGDVWNSSLHYLQVGGVTAVGSPPTGNPVSVATFDGTNKQHLKGNTDGTLAVGGFSAGPSVTLTRPANVTAYSAQDEVATAGTAATSISVSRLTGGTGLLDGCRLIYSANPAVTPAFRLLIFNANVTAAGDNLALNLSTTDANKAIGIIDFTVTQAGGTATSAPLVMMGAPVAPIKFTTDTVFLLLITTNAFTPIAASETVKLMLGAEMN